MCNETHRYVCLGGGNEHRVKIDKEEKASFAAINCIYLLMFTQFLSHIEAVSFCVAAAADVSSSSSSTSTHHRRHHHHFHHGIVNKTPQA